MLLGEPSGGLTDVDLDCPEAIAAAPYFLPHPTARFGRASKRCSHWLYKTDLCRTKDKATIQFKDPEKQVILEIRIGGGGSGAQTVFPGSTHEDTGEPILWEDDSAVGEIGGEVLIVVWRAYRRLFSDRPALPATGRAAQRRARLRRVSGALRVGRS